MQGVASKGGPVGHCLCCGIWVYKFLKLDIIPSV